jgi:hypothetical protein
MWNNPRPEADPKFQDVIAAARPHLSDAESLELAELLTDYGDIFTMQSDDYGRTDRVYHRMDTGKRRTIHQPQRRLSLAKWMLVGCSGTCNDLGLSKSQTAPGHLRVFVRKNGVIN